MHHRLRFLLAPLTVRPFSILFIGLAMSTDAFAAAISKGSAMHRPTLLQALRAGLIFGAIEGLTPVLGWLLGLVATAYIAAWDHWLAFILLSALGAHMIYTGLNADSGRSCASHSHAFAAPAKPPTITRRGQGFWILALTGFATSIDAMVIGVSLALLEMPIAVVAAVIGLCTFIMVTLGVLLGRVLGTVVGKRAEVVGGLMLIAIGLSILSEHLLQI